MSDCGRDLPLSSSKADISRQINEKVHEVYFAGAHADVGGGYDDGVGMLSGVSLNWMVRRAREARLFTSQSSLTTGDVHDRFSADPFAKAHDPEGEFPFNLIYKRMYRAIDAYADSIMSTTPDIKFHISLKNRIEAQSRTRAEYAGPDVEAQRRVKTAGVNSRFNRCFQQRGSAHKYVRVDDCKILIVED